MLLPDKAPTEAFLMYFNYANVFSPNLAIELAEYTRINNHAIELKEDKQPPYDPIYSLGSMKLEKLKTYIKTHLKTRFI